MKKFKLFKMLAVLIVLITSINTAWGQMFGSIGQQENAIQSQQIMSGGVYKGTVYEPFDNTTPSELSEVGSSYSPSRESEPRRSPLTPGDPGQGPSPVGEPWIMLLFAALFAGFIAIRQYKRKMNKSTNMKNSNRFIAVLGLLLTLSVGQMWADRTYDGTEKLYIKNAKPYYRENNQDKTWENTWIQSSSQYMHIAFRATHDGDVTWATATYYKGGSNAYDENAIYEVVVPSGTWEYLLIVRSGSSTAGWGWNNTGEISISTTQNMITNFKINDGYAAWAYVPLTVSANDPVYVYFDNSNANWDNKIQFVIGHSTYGRAYPLVKLAGTKLAYKNLEDVYDGSWSDATYYAVAQKSTDLTSADGASNYDYSSVTSNATKYTAAYRNRNAFDLSANNTFLCTTSTGNNGTAWSITYKSGGYSDLNNTQTIYKSLNNSTSSADVGTISITTTKLTGDVTGSENNSTATIGTSASNASADAVITATVSLSVSENTGYIFDGWSTTANGDIVEGSNTSLWTYTANSTNTYYAKFHYSSTSITLNKNGGSDDGSATITFASNTLTDYDAAEPTGDYALTGYYTSSDELIIDATGHLVASTSYTDGSGNWTSELSSLTLYAHWSLSRTITYHGNGNTGGSAPSAGVYENGATATVATKGDLAKTGYSFTGWNTEYDGTGDPYAEGATFSISSNMDLYAQWSEDKHDITINHGTGGTKAGIVTTATITCDNADEGKKFNGWDITGTYSLVGEGASLSDREITLHASTDLTVTATYTNRSYKKVYFQNKDNWTKVHAYVWQSDNTSNNNTWPGVEITEQTECVNGMTFHYYLFYTDDNDEGDDATSQANWDQVIFSNNGSSQTQDLSLTNGNYYTPGAAKNSAGNDPTADEWYLKGDWDSWGAGTAFSFATPCGKGTVDKNSWAAATSHAFKIYRSSTSEWWRYDGDISLGSELALTNASGSDNTYSPTTASDYQFRLDVSDVNNPVLTLVDKNAAGYTVTLRAGANGSVTNAGSLMIYEAMNTEITAVPDPGYNFASWSVDDDHASHVTITGTNPAIITANDASAAGAVITANFTNANMIYFDKSAVVGVWSGDDVYVTFFNDNDHWVEYYEGDVRKERVKMQNWVSGLMSKKMDKIPNSNIYYTSTDTDSDGDSEATQWYMFTDKNMVNGGTTWEQAAVCRADYSSACNIFVVENYVEKSVAKTGFYYGYWMKYNETTPGIKLHIYEKGGTTNIEGSPFTFSTLEAGSTEFTVTVPLAVANNSYGIELKGDNGIYYKNNGNLTSNNCTNWDYVERQATRGTITTTAAGDYKITLSCADKLFLSVEYPLQVGDYRIVYSGPMDTTSTVHTHSSKIIRQLREGETSRKDTVSFYVIDDGEGDPDWSITLQKCTDLDPITWEDACVSAEYTPSSLGLSGKQGVYTFPMELTASGTCDAITLGTPIQYQGNFYIRTDGAKGGWEAYKKAADNCMGYSNFSEGHSGYGFYYCHFGNTGDNVKFVVANDYSPEVSLTLDGGDYIPSEGANKGKLPYDANIRFMYDSVTNVVRRAYINGSSYGEANYLLLEGDSKIKRADVDKAFVNNDTTFADNGNWIYQLDLRAQPGARVRLTSNYRFNNTDHLQYFEGKEGDFGTSTTEQILGGSGSDWSTLRIIYDFKTNQMVSAWLATDDPVEGPKPIFADVMIVREGQENPVQITFTENGSGEEGKLTDVGIVYGVMKFNKSTVNGSGSAYERSLFFISFPFDVKISEIFGFGGFCNQWYLEYYDGKGRAENGFWAESATNWKFITDRTDTLKANEGYVLALDLDLMGTTSSVWDNTSEVCLYFPSADTIHNIQATTKSVDINQTGYLCTIDRYQGGATGLSSDYDRRIKDSYWHCIGVPSFANQVLTIHNGDHDGEAEGTAEYWEAEALPYFYDWNKTTNEMTVRSTTNFTFVPMNAYLVQYSQSSLNWGAVNGVVASSVARRRSAELEQSCEFNLSLTKNGNEMDHTYVRLINKEGVTEGFDFGQDLSKEMNAYTANIYTMIGYEKAAANSMPLNNAETTTIPVGVKLAQGGDYTFAMPDGTHGVGVTLIDTETGIRTSLSALDYTVNLTPGSYDNRFVLEISPINNAPTNIDNVNGNDEQGAKVRKVLIDGVLYIVKDGKIFDARGIRVQ